MAVINLLDKEVYELIAAGEVIDRPASVIKELLENAADAGADSVTVEIKNGGRTYMRVTDNGSGICPEDVPTAFLRHATSKVSEKTDLDCIRTLGFRGEALASICAVAKVELLTKMRGSQFGTRYAIAGGEQTVYEPAGCPDGTSIIVRDLFFNVPARLKFLKKDATEANRIQDLMGKLAISHPEISVKLIRDNYQVFVTAGDGKLYTAVYSVLGRDFANSLIPVDYSAEGVSVKGYISKPLASRSNRKLQTFYVNGRYVKSEVCSQALEEAYRNGIMVGKFPACVLKLDIPPEMIDVNVHPAKTEVRFSDNRYVYNAVYFAVKQALTEKDSPTRMKLDNGLFYDKAKLYTEPPQPKAEQMVFSPSEETSERGTGEDGSAEGDLFLKTLSEKPWEGVLQPADLAREKAAATAPSSKMNENYNDDEFFKLCEEYNVSSSDSGDTAAPADEKADEAEERENGEGEKYMFVKAEDFEKRVTPPVIAEDEKPEEKPRPTVVGELFKTYIVAQCGDDMILIDKHAAHERYIFENIKNDSRNLSSQTLLEPFMVMLSFDEYDALAANLDKAEKLGFIIEPDVAPTVAVLGLPMLLKDENPSDIVTEIAHKLYMNERDPAPDLYDDLYHTMACKAAIKANDDSKTLELQKLADCVYGEDIRYCPHGRPVMITMPKREIEKQFKRIV